MRAEHERGAWYHQTWFIITSFIFFFPLGIVLLISKQRKNPANDTQRGLVVHEERTSARSKVTKKTIKEVSLDEAQNLWYQWGFCHSQGSQRKRIDRVLYGDFNNPMVLRHSATAYYDGNKGDTYTTTLDQCSCPDFSKSQKPCKHMYFLAYKLGVFNLVDDDDHHVTLLRILHFLPEESLGYLSTMIWKTAEKDEKYFLFPKEEESELLLTKGYCYKVSVSTVVLDTFPVAKIKEMFSFVNLPNKPPMTAQKKTLLKWFNENKEAIVQSVDEWFYIFELTDCIPRKKQLFLERIASVRGKLFDHLV